MLALVERARRGGLSKISVDANTHALAFYRRAGFAEVGTVELQLGPVPRMLLPVCD